MPIALYTPAARPDPAAPWGGPRLMRLVARALETAGYHTIAPTEFWSDEGLADNRQQAALERKAARRARKLVTAYRDFPAVARPEAWLTCDLRHTAPDLIGPAVAEALGIPYLLVGAAYARAEAGGAHARWLSYTARAIARARAVLSLTPRTRRASGRSSQAPRGSTGWRPSSTSRPTGRWTATLPAERWRTNCRSIPRARGFWQSPRCRPARHWLPGACWGVRST